MLQYSTRHVAKVIYVGETDAVATVTFSEVAVMGSTRQASGQRSECERAKRPPYYPMLLYIYFVAGSEQLSSESNAIRLMAWYAYVGRETVQSSPKHLLHFSDRATSRLQTQISSQRVMYLISSSLVCWFVSKVPPEKIESIPISYTA
jgi:hypothetical protein